ncbi:helix-turn-helix transcriptional regulator [Qipengyuania sp. RANM35]|uniref:helix-turn-helix transcriptional regulator n=1 Tax=Qipengyuania sp. RANM35 TaxID=3068635 RepID=UPI0034DAE283
MANALYSPLLNREEAAHYLGISFSTLARWAMLGKGPAFHKIGRQARYKISELDAFIDSQSIELVRGRSSKL